MMTNIRVQAAVVVLLLGGTATIHAAPVGATLTLSDVDGQQFSDLLLVNDSASAQLTSFNLTIGDTTFGFDRFLEPLTECGTTIASCTLTSPDNIQNNNGEPNISLDFTGFDPGESLAIVDIDVDFASGSADDFDPSNRLDVILFNNGLAPNAVFSATFSSGEMLSMTLPDSADAPSYTFQLAVVPVPAAVWLFGSAFVVLGWFRRRAL